MRINTVGVVLTDKAGSIVGAEDKPAFMFMPKSVRALDQAIMRRAIQSQKNPIIVIGENTFNEIRYRNLGNMLAEMKCPVFVSNKTGVSLYEQVDSEDPTQAWEYTGEADSKEELRRIVYASAYVGMGSATINRNPYTIVVLGGYSVYDAFDYHYTEIHHNQYKGDIEGTRHLNVVGEDPRDMYNDDQPEKAMMIKDKSEVMYSDQDFVYYVHTTGETK